jgi:hypothetical protein
MAKKKAPIRKPRRSSGSPLIDPVAKENCSARAAKAAASTVKSPRHVANATARRWIEAKPKPRASHIWRKQATSCYVDPPCCSAGLFAVEPFEGRIHDPCCGTRNIIKSAQAAGFHATGSDLVPRDGARPVDFLRSGRIHDNIVMNPPYARGQPEAFARHALELARYKVEFLFPVARLNAAHWLDTMPRRRLWLLSPRPSMPPVEYILAGKKPQGGRVDFCWVVLEAGYSGPWETARLLLRERNKGFIKWK